MHPERTRQGVTLLLLWQEDNAATPEGCQYSGVCHAYRHWAGKRDRGMRQSHRAGDKLFVADAGQGLPSVNRHSGAMHAAAVCIAVLGASHYTAAAAPWPQSLPDWMGSHVRTFAALGGVPEVVVPDPLKAAGNRAHRYEPESKRTEGDRAHHDGIAIMPARAARPRDKAPVEVGGQVVERWIVARLRNHTVFSRAEAKGARHDLLPARHARPFQQLPGSRPSLFASLDRPA